MIIKFIWEENSLEDIILDCDPGHDDAIAMILAVSSPKINLLGVTTSSGNQRHGQTLRNAMSMLTLMNQQSVPVASGNHAPLMRKLISGVSMHGFTGLDGAELPMPNFHAKSMPATEMIADIVANHDEKVTIVITGPCTNIALYLAIHPEQKNRIKRIVIMGGAMGVGNWGPTTEFNIQVDPEAAQMVIDSGIPITLVPLNVAFEAQLLDEDLKKIRKFKNPVSEVVSGLLEFYGMKFDMHWDFEGLPLYDVCTIAWLIDPDKFEGKNVNVEVETRGDLTAGETVIDYYGISRRKPNAEVLFHIDRPWFANTIIDSVKSFNE